MLLYKNKIPYQIKLRFALLLLIQIILGPTAMMSCGGDDSSPPPVIDPAGPLTSIQTLETLLIDQMSFYVPDDVSISDLEIWITDAQSGEDLLCASQNNGINEITTETVIYGNLEIGFNRLVNNGNQENSLFLVKLFNNPGNSCRINNQLHLLGESLQINYDTLKEKPVLASNGAFYIRMRPSASPSHQLPHTLTNTFASNTLLLDQVYLSDSIALDQESLRAEIHIINNNTGETIMCGGNSTGLGSIQKVGRSYAKLLSDFLPDTNFDENLGEEVHIKIIDRNTANRCPDAINNNDQVLSESAVMNWDNLPGKTVIMNDNESYVLFNHLSQ